MHNCRRLGDRQICDFGSFACEFARITRRLYGEGSKRVQEGELFCTAVLARSLCWAAGAFIQAVERRFGGFFRLSRRLRIVGPTIRGISVSRLNVRIDRHREKSAGLTHLLPAMPDLPREIHQRRRPGH
jgi:hypothetical protein